MRRSSRLASGRREGKDPLPSTYIAPAPQVRDVIAGETNLMGAAHLTNVEKLRRLFEAFTQKRDILHLLDQALQHAHWQTADTVAVPAEVADDPAGTKPRYLN